MIRATSLPSGAAGPGVRPPRRRWLILVLAWAAFTMTSLDRSVWGPAAPSVGRALSVSLASLGVFATAYYVGYVVSNLLGGMASDAVGPRRVLAGSMVFAGLGMMAFGSVTSMAAGLVIQALVGLFAGADYSAGATSLAAWFTGRERNIAVGLYTTATSLGTVLANVLIPTMIADHGWQLSYRLFGGISVLLGLVILVLHRDAPPRVVEAGAPAGPDRGPGGSGGPAAGRADGPERTGAVLRRLTGVFADRNLLLLGVAGFLSLWGTYGFITWSNTLMIRGRGIDAVDAGRVVALFAITAVVLKPLVGVLAARAPRRRAALAASILLLFAATLLVFGRLTALPQFYVAAPILGFAAYCYSPIQNALILDYARGDAAGSAAGSLNAFWQLGSVVVPAVVGIVFDATNSVYVAFVTLAAGPALGALVMLTLRPPAADGGDPEGGTGVAQ